MASGVQTISQPYQTWVREATLLFYQAACSSPMAALLGVGFHMASCTGITEPQNGLGWKGLVEVTCSKLKMSGFKTKAAAVAEFYQNKGSFVHELSASLEAVVVQATT